MLEISQSFLSVKPLPGEHLIHFRFASKFSGAEPSSHLSQTFRMFACQSFQPKLQAFIPKHLLQKQDFDMTQCKGMTADP